MAKTTKKTQPPVTLELEPKEAEALHALLGEMSGIEGAFHEELSEIFNLLDEAGVRSGDHRIEWLSDPRGGALRRREA